MRQLFLAGFIAAVLAVPAYAPARADDDAPPANNSSASAVLAPAAKPAAPSKNVLARVEGKDITRKDLDAFLDKLPPQARILPKPILEPMALDQLINDQLLLKAANAEDVADSKEYQTRLAELKDQLLREVYIKQKVEKKVTDDALHDEFDKFRKENPEQTEYRARHMLVDSKDKAEDLIKQLDSGADFAKLAGQNNKGPEKEKGGELGYFTAKEVVPEFSEAVAKMKVGDYTKEPVQTKFGWHVIQLEDKRTRPAPKFDAVKDQLRQRVEQKLVQEEIAKLRKDAKVEVFTDNLPQMPKMAAPKAENGQKGQAAPKDDDSN